MKSKQVYVCSECGAETSKWQGKCLNCGAWNTLEMREAVSAQMAAISQDLEALSRIVNLGDAKDTKKNKVSSGFQEFDLVLGGGFIDNQVVVLSGEPGIGKSTLLLQIVHNLVAAKHKCIYFSGEESAAQVSGRYNRIYPQNTKQNVQFSSSPDLAIILSFVAKEKPEFVIVDSIQTLFDNEVPSLPGSLAQIKTCAAKLIAAAKQQGFVLVMVGHINKDGDIAGPKALEHLVDTVLRFEGERDGHYRIIRVMKNRFGSTGEVALMEMSEMGLVDADMSQGLFTGDGHDAVGAVKTMILEGNRPLIVQVQALTNRTVFPYPKRVAEGVSISRLQLICAILDRFAGTSLGDQDVYVRTAGGYNLQGTASDLAVAAAILSSLNKRQIASSDLYVGELSLGGRISLPPQYSSKFVSLSKMGVRDLWGNVGDQTAKGVRMHKLTSLSELG